MRGRNSSNSGEEISLTAFREPRKPWKIQNQERNFSIKNLYIATDGITSSLVEKLWDAIELTRLEDEVIKALKLILPELEKIGLKILLNDSTQRFPYAKVREYYQPLPLRSFGDGMNRLFGFALALANCGGGILMIDEIENGLHYSVLLDVWRLIFNTARELNVQVFATTHSLDCIKAFQRAAEEDKKDEGMLIRLARKGDKIKAVLFDEREMETVVENNIEVR